MSGRMKDGEKGLFPQPSPTVCDGPHCPGGRGMKGKSSSTALIHCLVLSLLSLRAKAILGMMNSATSPSAPRRMTALVEMSENQMKTKGGFCPVLVKQILLTRPFLTK